MPGDQPARDLGARSARDHGLGAGAAVAAGEPIELERRLQPLAPQQLGTARQGVGRARADLGEIARSIESDGFNRAQDGRIGSKDAVMEAGDRDAPLSVMQARHQPRERA